MSLDYKFIVFEENIALFVNMNEVTFEVNQEDEKRNNIRGTFLDIPELEGYQCSLKEDDVGLYVIGGLWWADQGSFAINGETRSKLTIRCLYPERLDDVPILFKYLDFEVTEEDAERYEQEEIERTREREIVRVAGDIAGEYSTARFILDDFRDYDLVSEDRKHVNQVEIDAASADMFIENAEYPLDFAERWGPKWSIENQLPDVKVIPMTKKNIRLAGDLIPMSIRQFLDKTLNKDRYCLVIGFRHLHDEGFSRVRCLTTMVLLESKRIDTNDVIKYAIQNFDKTEKALLWSCEFLAEVGQYKAFAMLYGKSQHRFKTNSLTLSPQELTFPVVTGKTVWIVEGQNDALALYHYMARKGIKKQPDIVLNIGTANLRVFDRTDLPMFCPRSTELIMFLDNLELNIEAAKMLYVEKGYRRIGLAQDRFPFLQRTIPVQTLEQQYRKAQDFVAMFLDVDLEKFYHQEVSDPTIKRKAITIAGEVSLGMLPGLDKKLKPIADYDADDYVSDLMRLENDS